MDAKQLEQRLAEYQAHQNRLRLEQAVQRELTIAGGMGAAAANVAGLIHQAQQNANNQIYHGTAHAPVHLPNAAQMGQSVGSGTYPDNDEDRTTRHLLASFKEKDKSTYEFAEATAQLLSAKIRASYSPNRSPHCSPRHEYIVWQLFNHNWMVDVQWVGDATGGSEEEWTAHFAKLADRISDARANGEKQWGDEPYPTYFSGYSQAQALTAFGQQNAGIVNQQAVQNQLAHMLGVGHASLAGQQAQSGPGSSGGGSSQADLAGAALGMGF